MPHLEHIGIAVRDPNAVARLYETLLARRPYKSERVAQEGVETHFISAQTTKLELLEALSPDSPIARYLDKRGEGLHHLAFEVEDLHAEMQRLRAAGFSPLSDAPRTGADGKLIFFLHPKQTHGVLVEYCQSLPLPAPTRLPILKSKLRTTVCGASHNPALVMLHDGSEVSLEDTMSRRRYLEPHLYLLAVEPEEEQPAPPPDPVELLAGILEHFDLTAAHLWGAARGALTALQFARQYPGRLRGLVLHAPPALPNPFPAPSLSSPPLITTLDETVSLDNALALRRSLPASTLAVLPGPQRTLPAALYAQHLLHALDSPQG